MKTIFEKFKSLFYLLFKLTNLRYLFYRFMVFKYEIEQVINLLFNTKNRFGKKNNSKNIFSTKVILTI